MAVWNAFVQNLHNIACAIWDTLLYCIAYMIGLVFDMLIGIINLLPTTTPITSDTAPLNTVWTFLLQSLNYFCDVGGMISLLGMAITMHLALVVGVGALRFFQVMD
jgi:hypothetical protein